LWQQPHPSYQALGELVNSATHFQTHLNLNNKQQTPHTITTIPMIFSSANKHAQDRISQ